MKVVRFDYQNLPQNLDKISIILGYFDGVHLGHQALINYARKMAKNRLALMTFSVPVSKFIKNTKNSQILTSLDDRFRIISKLGVDDYYVVNIDANFLNFEAEKFIEILRKLNVCEVFCGSDFRFGKNRLGTPELLTKYFDVKMFDLVTDNGEKISAQDIKYLISNGNIQEANRLLGHNYMISGTVVHGQQIGRKLGKPTMNVKPSDEYVFPKFGVYKTIAYVDNVPHLAVTNVGVKPTIDNCDVVTIEAHLENYHEEKYTETIQLEFLEFIREERKFNSLDDLKNQIEEDCQKVFGH